MEKKSDENVYQNCIGKEIIYKRPLKGKRLGITSMKRMTFVLRWL